MTSDEPPLDLAAWREAYRAGMRPASAACPPEEDLAALATGEIEAGARIAIADHVVACRRCADAHQVLAELHREARGRARARAWLGLASAAAVALVAAGILIARPGAGPSGAPPSSELRGSAAAALSPAPNAVLDAAPAALTWSALPGVRRYRARLYDAGGDPLWEAVAAGERVALPDEAARRLAAGHAYFWTVEPMEAGMAGRLGPYWFQIRERR